jgi:heme-degrading monooxygenase HmoA
MITEIGHLEIKPGSDKDFEAAAVKAGALLERAKGCIGFEMRRSIERPSRYHVLVRWKTLENHTVDFINSKDGAECFKLLGQFFVAPPDAEHTALVLSSAD